MRLFMSIMSGAALLGFACATVVAQKEAPLSFEVASIKPAVLGNGPIMIGFRGGPGTNDPGRATYNAVSLKMLLQNAFDVKPYQVSGPSWLDTERFDIVATVPDGATKDQFKIMLQNLLVDRFGLKFHRETKDFPLYELTVAKNGPKLKPAAPAAPGTADVLPPSGPPPIGKDGMPQLPAGRPGAFIMMRPGPRLQMKATMQSMQQLGDMLGNQLGVPVVDRTGLSGNYDFLLDFALEPGQGPAGLPPPPPPPPGGDAGPKVADHLADAGDAPNLMTAVQEQLGLKLEKKKGPLAIMVIDHAERTPTEN